MPAEKAKKGTGRRRGNANPGARGGRTRRVYLTVSRDEEAEIRAGAAAAGVSLASYLRNRALGREVEIRRGRPPSNEVEKSEAPVASAGADDGPVALVETEEHGIEPEAEFVARRTRELVAAGRRGPIAGAEARAEWRRLTEAAA